MNLKKLISGTSVATLALAGAASASSFNDVAGHWVETGSFLDTAIEAGIIDGTKPSFNPNDSITRAALTKMVAVYSNGGDTITAVDYDESANFADVSADAWYYDVVNYAAEAGIVDGDKTNFEPGRAVNRAEAVKVIVLALEVKSVDVTLPYTDVSSDAWYAPYVRNAYGNCVIKGGSNFNPAAPITRAAAVKVFVSSINPSCGETVAPTATPVATATSVATATPDASVSATPTPVVTTDATVEVVVSQNSPAAQSIPKNAYQVPFLALDITASNDEDLLLTGLTVQHTGLGDADEVQNVQVFDGVIPRGSDKNFSGEDDVATLNLQGDAIVIEAGTTKTVYIKADINTDANNETAGEHAVALLNADSVILIGKTTGAVVSTTGSFPIVGETMSVANITVGSATVTLEKPSDSTVNAGEKDVEVARFNVEASSVEDIYVSTITLETSGLLDDGNVENFYIEIDGDRVSNVVAASVNDKVTFVLTETDAAGYKILDGSDKTFVVKADFTGAIDTFRDDAFGLFLDEASDITVTGAKYGFGVQKTLTGVSESYLTADYLIDIDGGDITFVLDSTATDVAEDTDDVIFGTLTIVNQAESIEIDKNGYKFELITNDSVSSDDLENIKLVSAKNNSTILGTVDAQTVENCTADCTQTLDWNEDLYIGAGETAVFYIVADTKDNLVEDSTYKFKLSSTDSSDDGLENIKVTGQVSDETTGFDIKPAGTLTTKDFTLQEAGITVTNKTLQSDTYVASTKGAVVWNGTIRADNVKDISVERLEFTETGTSTDSDLNSYTVQANVNGAWVNVESGVNVGSTFTFSDLDELTSGKFVVTKGDEVEIRVLVDVADEVNADNDVTVIVTLTSVEFQEIETDGTYGDTTTLDFNYSAVAFTLVDAGTLAVTLDSADTPNDELLVAGTTDNTVAVYKVKADDEDVTLNDVNVIINEATTEFSKFSSVESTATVATTIAANTEHKNDRITIALTSEETGVGTKFRVILADATDSDTPEIAGVGTAVIYEVTGSETGGLSGIATDFAAKITSDIDGVTATANSNVITIERDGTDTDGDADLSIDDTTATGGTTAAAGKLAVSTDGGTDYNDSEAKIDDTLADGDTDEGQTSTITITGTVKATDIFEVFEDGVSLGTVTDKTTANDVATAIAALTYNDTDSSDSVTATSSDNVVTVVATDATDDGTLASFDLSVTVNGSATTADITDDKDAISSVSLYNGTTLLKTQTIEEITTGVWGAKFEDINWTVEAGNTEQLTVKVNLNNIGTNSSDTAQSGHVFNTSLVVVEAKGTESGDVLTVTSPTAPTADFVVTNNNIQIAKLEQNSSLSNGPVELLKFKAFDASADGDRAEITKFVFDITDTGATSADYELVGGNAVWDCDAAGTCTITDGVEEISASGTTFVLRATITDATSDDSVVAKLVINEASAGTDGVTWTDGGNGSDATANGASINWVDFGEADETTTYITNTVSN